MNRRDVFKAIFGAAVMVAVPAAPVKWEELPPYWRDPRTALTSKHGYVFAREDIKRGQLVAIDDNLNAQLMRADSWRRGDLFSVALGDIAAGALGVVQTSGVVSMKTATDAWRKIL